MASDPPFHIPIPSEAQVEYTLDHAPAIMGHSILGAGIIATILEWLPPMIGLVAALAGSTYYCICVWESRTVQHAVNNWRMKRHARKVFRLKAKAKVVQAKLEALEKVRMARREARQLVETAATEAAKATAVHEAKIAEKSPPD